MNVPVLGIPILNKPELLYSMLGTFDHDVDRLYIIDNGGVVDPARIAGFRANDIHIADLGFNLGVGPAWNMIIRANINAPWWLIGCNDMSLSPGAVNRLVQDMEEHAGTPHMSRVVMGNESWGNHFGLFALNPEAIDMVGWFDENIYPIYFEDNDFLEKVKRAEKYGFTNTLIQSATQHAGNASWKDVPHNAIGNKRTWDMNGSYYESKWRPAGEDVEYPFDIGELGGLRYQPAITVQRLREQDWNITRKDNVKNEGIIS